MRRTLFSQLMKVGSRRMSTTPATGALQPLVRLTSATKNNYNFETDRVNAQYIPDKLEPLQPLTNSNEIDLDLSGPLAKHWDESWSEADLRKAGDDHVVATWGPTKAVKGLPLITHGEGVYLFDSTGKKYLDWTSQAVCSNLGHTVPSAVKKAINHQVETLPMVYGGMGLTEVRLRLARLMSEVSPGDINGFVFPSGGGEANEAAIRIARRFTGRDKILNQYRSYHGGSATSLTATGDFRRWFAERGATGFVKMFNPQPFGFKWGDTDKEKTDLLLAMLDEQIRMEGPETIAAIMLEPIVGAGGALVPPVGYFEGVRAMCDKYEILLIADEVMVGFGRTGKFWGFQHFEGVIPDIVTSAKGLSAAVMPLAVLGMRQHIKEFFEDVPLGWGATYANHPVALACAYECVKHVIKEQLPSRAAALEPVMVEQMQHLVEAHPSVRQARAIGLFGCLDLVGPDGNMIQQYQQPNPLKVLEFKKAMLEGGLMGLFRPPLLHCAPPLIIDEAELLDGFQRLDKALYTLD